MLQILKNSWNGPVEYNGILYDSIDSMISKGVLTNIDGNINIKLLHPQKKEPQQKPTQIGEKQEYLITVRQYMTQKSNSTFDFMLKYNKDIPMPLRTMIGTKEKETKGMVYMKLHADIYADKIQKCMKCGRAITNPISKYFGMGPECGGHKYTNPFNSEEELKKSIQAYRKELQKITWSGWIVKSAIIEEEMYNGKSN